MTLCGNPEKTALSRNGRLVFFDNCSIGVLQQAPYEDMEISNKKDRGFNPRGQEF